MNLVPLCEAAQRGELVLVNGGMCHYHLRRDGLVTVRELLVLPDRRRCGLGRSLVAEVVRRHPNCEVRAKCPADWPANGFWERLGFRRGGLESGAVVWSMPSKLVSVELIYCAAGNPAFGRMAVEAGWLYGARLPDWFDRELPLHFADQDWREPDRKRYMSALAEYKPVIATVLDLERRDQLSEVLDWAGEAAEHVSRVVVIPKVRGVVERLPRKVGPADVVLGYSVPTSYGGTTLPLSEFAGWRVHLLGGSPQSQLRLTTVLDVVSADGGMPQQQAMKCRYWSSIKGNKGHWVQLRDAPGGSDVGDGAHWECFKRSLAEIKRTWSQTVTCKQQPAETPPLPKKVR